MAVLEWMTLGIAVAVVWQSQWSFRGVGVLPFNKPVRCAAGNEEPSEIIEHRTCHFTMTSIIRRGHSMSGLIARVVGVAAIVCVGVGNGTPSALGVALAGDGPAVIAKIKPSDSSKADKRKAASQLLSSALKESPKIAEAMQQAAAYRKIAEVQAAADDPAGARRTLALAHASAAHIAEALRREQAFLETAKTRLAVGDTAGACQSLKMADAAASQMQKGDALSEIAYDEIIKTFGEAAKTETEAGDKKAARETLKMAKATAAKLDNVYGRAQAYCNIAKLQAKAGDMTGARETIESAKELAATRTTARLTAASSAIGDCWRHRKRQGTGTAHEIQGIHGDGFPRHRRDTSHGRRLGGGQDYRIGNRRRKGKGVRLHDHRRHPSQGPATRRASPLRPLKKPNCGGRLSTTNSTAATPYNGAPTAKSPPRK